MRKLSAGPLIAVPSRNCALVHTDAAVVISLMTTAQYGQQSDGWIVAASFVDGGLPVAITYKLTSLPGVASLFRVNRPSASVVA
jgi:hypothetical protein